MTSTGFACTLDVDGARSRAEQLRRLAVRILSEERHRRRAVLRFPADARDEIGRFVADEGGRCCTFFGFDVAEHEHAVILTIDVPEGAEPLLDDLLDALDRDAPDEQALASIDRLRGPGSGVT